MKRKSLYNKPKDLKYTDMAIYIDENIYREDLSEEEKEKIYEYIYHLVKMLAYKEKFFNKDFYYEDFAIYAATNIYMRLTSPKQFIYNESGEPNLSKIKSILNYIKAVIYPRKVKFEQEFYAQTTSEESYEILTNSPYSFSDKLYEFTDDLNIVEFNNCLEDVCKTAKSFLKKIPYPRDSVEWINIYISCLLTFINYITLPNSEIESVNNFESYEDRLRHIQVAFQRQQKDEPILYHLDSSMSNYVKVLVTELKHAIAKDLSSLTHTYIPSNSGVNRLMLASINGLEDDKDRT